MVRSKLVPRMFHSKILRRYVKYLLIMKCCWYYEWQIHIVNYMTMNITMNIIDRKKIKYWFTALCALGILHIFVYYFL